MSTKNSGFSYAILGSSVTFIAMISWQSAHSPVAMRQAEYGESFDAPVSPHTMLFNGGREDSFIYRLSAKQNRELKIEFCFSQNFIGITDTNLSGLTGERGRSFTDCDAANFTGAVIFSGQDPDKILGEINRKFKPLVSPPKLMAFNEDFASAAKFYGYNGKLTNAYLSPFAISNVAQRDSR